jgi:predicted DNA binding CopG/RHH family protein
MGYKRIIDGKSYNTDTATIVHEVSARGDTVYEGLYQTKHEAFFLYWYDEAREAGDIKPMPDDEARKWLDRHKAPAALIEKYFFGTFPEAGAAEVRITVRLPGNLHSRITASAAAENLSLNTYLMRLLERSERPFIE